MKQIYLMFHDVYKNNTEETGFRGIGANLYKLPLSKFESFIYYIKSLDDANRYVLTFDDGGVSFYDTIAPILDSFKLRGIFFIATSRIGTDGFMNEKQIADLDKRGHIIGSHAHSHRPLTAIPKKEVINEWRISKEILERILGHEVCVASIPNGNQSRFVLNEAEKCSYRYIYTSEPICKVKKHGKMMLYGRFVLTKNTRLQDLRHLQSGAYRLLLFFRSKILSFMQLVLGASYTKIRNWIVK